MAVAVQIQRISRQTPESVRLVVQTFRRCSSCRSALLHPPRIVRSQHHRFQLASIRCSADHRARPHAGSATAAARVQALVSHTAPSGLGAPASQVRSPDCRCRDRGRHSPQCRSPGSSYAGSFLPAVDLGAGVGVSHTGCRPVGARYRFRSPDCRCRDRGRAFAAVQITARPRRLYPAAVDRCRHWRHRTESRPA
jgi:hypothetical protein